MTPFVEDADFALHVGDVREVLPELPAESVDCALTSPPFYALRDYGMKGQIGLEASPEEWCAELVAVFGEVRRVLKPAGTLWIECGDSYNAGTGGRQPTQTSTSDMGNWQRAGEMGDRRIDVPGLKVKDLLGTPWLLAFALRADGWWLRQCIIWHKPNAMPESATDRCTTGHSYVFLLSKQARYYFDAEAIEEPAEWAAWGKQTDLKRGLKGSENARGTGMGFDTYGRQKIRELQGIGKPQDSDLFNPGNRNGNGQKGRTDERRGFDNRLEREDGRKNARSVWSIPTQGYPDAHFATWPEALCERIIKAGCPEGGVCLDPFMGSGTTALVARRLGRKSVGIELSPEYAALAARRLQQLSLLA